MECVCCAMNNTYFGVQLYLVYMVEPIEVFTSKGSAKISVKLAEAECSHGARYKLSELLDLNFNHTFFLAG